MTGQKEVKGTLMTDIPDGVLPVCISKARCPIAKDGSVPMPNMSGSSFWSTFLCDLCSSSLSIHFCPLRPTYCRSSSQMMQPSGFKLASVGYCAPQVTQTAGMRVTRRMEQLRGAVYVDLNKSRIPALQGVKSRNGRVSAWCTQDGLCGMQYQALKPRNPSRLAEYAGARVADMPSAAQPRMQTLSVSDSRSSIQAL